jgi:hypothetical protein
MKRFPPDLIISVVAVLGGSRKFPVICSYSLELEVPMPTLPPPACKARLPDATPPM